MEPVRATLIVNPYASSVTEEAVRAVERELAAAYELETVLTERRGHAIEFARDAATETIFSFGGDGVANEVLNCVSGDRTLGFVPGGGTNVLPRALGLPRDAVETARRLPAATPRRISLGRANGRRFAFSAGIGLDSQSVRTGLELANTARPDVVEVLPGILPEVISDVRHRCGRPVIAGGMRSNCIK